MIDAELEAVKIQKNGGREVPQSVPTLKESVLPPGVLTPTAFTGQYVFSEHS